MEQSPSSEANSHSASQEITRPLWKPKVHYRVYNSPPLVPILNQMNPVYTFPHYFPRIDLVLSSHLRLDLPSGLIRSGFPTKILYVFLISPCTLHAPTTSASFIWSPQ
jgi:hypothetical protein